MTDTQRPEDVVHDVAAWLVENGMRTMAGELRGALAALTAELEEAKQAHEVLDAKLTQALSRLDEPAADTGAPERRNA